MAELDDSEALGHGDEGGGSERRRDPEVGGRRGLVTRRPSSGPVAKAFQKMNILALCESYPFGARLARQADAQHLHLSLFWSAESLSMAVLPFFDAAIVDEALWPLVKDSLLAGHHVGRHCIGAIVLVDLRPGAAAAVTGTALQELAAPSPCGDVTVLRLPAGASVEEVLTSVAEIAQRNLSLREPQPQPQAPGAGPQTPD